MLFCFSTLALLPRSTLFPYTTLFRSYGLKSRGRENDGPGWEEKQRRPTRLPRTNSEQCIVEEDLHGGAGIGKDRKSTRLNSSHLGISYAVFCLKKKK